MLGFFSGKSDHPLADNKETKAILAELAELATREPAGCVDAAAGWFESLAGLDDIPAAVRSRRAAELAAASLPSARRLARDYLAAPRVPRAQEQQRWQRNHGYWLQLAGLLQRCLAESEAQRSPPGPLLAGLLIAHCGCLRWTQLRYGPLENQLWTDMGQAYLRAEAAGVADTAVEPFGSTEGSTSVTGEYLKGLIFHASSMGSLTPQEIGLAERFITHFLPHFVLSTDLRPESAYWVDAARPLPPTRLARLPELAPTLRFFGVGQALGAVRSMHERIAGSQMPPPEVNLGGQYAVPTLLAVLDHLSVCWSPKPPTRSHPRHRVKSRIGAAPGFRALHTLLAGGNPEQIGVESWLVEDISQGGMSVRLPLMRNDWVRIGALAGMQPEGAPHWLVGVVRRFARESEIHGLVGIETLSKSPRAATATDGVRPTDLLLLDPLRDDSSARVLMPPEKWEAGMPLQLFIDGHPWRLHPDEEMAAGDDWLLGRCIVESLDPDRR